MHVNHHMFDGAKRGKALKTKTKKPPQNETEQNLNVCAYAYKTIHTHTYMKRVNETSQMAMSYRVGRERNEKKTRKKRLTAPTVKLNHLSALDAWHERAKTRRRRSWEKYKRKENNNKCLCMCKRAVEVCYLYVCSCARVWQYAKWVK